MATAIKPRPAPSTVITTSPLLQPPPGVEIWESPLVPGVQHWVELVDRERALFMLDRVRERQRSVTDGTEYKYAEDMSGAAWVYVADPIRFSDDPREEDWQDINDDGQHRLRAIARSGKPQPMLIVRGLDPDAITVMDTGRGRTFTNTLELRRVPNASLVSSLTRIVWWWQHGNYADRGVLREVPEDHLGAGGIYQYAQASNPSLLATYQAMPDELIMCARQGQNLIRPFRPFGQLTQSVLAFGWLIFGRIDVDSREMFFHALTEGNGSHDPTDPIRKYRHRATLKRGKSEKREPNWLQFHHLVQTWDAWLNQESLNLSRPRPVLPENMAKITDPFSEIRSEGWEPL
jgi:hypothetical protein